MSTQPKKRSTTSRTTSRQSTKRKKVEISSEDEEKQKPKKKHTRTKKRKMVSFTCKVRPPEIPLPQWKLTDKEIDLHNRLVKR